MFRQPLSAFSSTERHQGFIRLRASVLVVLSFFLVACDRATQLNILTELIPKVTELLDPVPPNVPVEWTTGPTEAEQPPNERPPNIILILADDMGFNDVSLYNGGAGDGTVMTPNIDAIAQQGVTFNNGYAANAACAPSRASIMTGRYSTRFGFEFTPFPKIGLTLGDLFAEAYPPQLPSIVNDEAAANYPDDIGELGMPAEEVTIAEVLRDAGYYTAHIGKWHLGEVDGMSAYQQGFADSLNMSGLLYLPEDDDDVVNVKFKEDPIDTMVWTTGRYMSRFNDGTDFQPAGYLTDYYTDEAVKVIEENKNQPFFLYLAHWGIHNPLQAKKEDYDLFPHIEDKALRVYAAMIHALDRSVGRIIDTLEENGLTENTLIVFTSDNGGASYIQLPDINKPYRGWKTSFFEGGTHVPFMAKWPAQIQPGTTYDNPIHHNDLFKTFANAAGAAIPQNITYDGVDLMPYVKNENPGVPHETLFWRSGFQQTVYHQGWKLIVTDIPDKKWLFDLTTDPTEQNNVIDEHPAQVTLMEGLLAVHNAEQVEPLYPSVLAIPQFVDKHQGEELEEGDEYIYWPN